MSESTVREGLPCRLMKDTHPGEGTPEYCLEHGQFSWECRKEREYLGRIADLEGWLSELGAPLPHAERHLTGCIYCAWRMTTHPEEFRN